MGSAPSSYRPTGRGCGERGGRRRGALLLETRRCGHDFSPVMKPDPNVRIMVSDDPMATTSRTTEMVEP